MGLEGEGSGGRGGGSGLKGGGKWGLGTPMSNPSVMLMLSHSHRVTFGQIEIPLRVSFPLS